MMVTIPGLFHSLTQSGNHRISRPRVGQPEGHIGLIKGGGVIKRTAASVHAPTALAARTALQQQQQQQPVSTINIAEDLTIPGTIDTIDTDHDIYNNYV